MKKLLLLIILAGFAACSSVKTTFDYDKQIDFSKYQTYQMVQDELTQEIGQLNRDRMISALQRELAAKGFSPSESPDAYVDIHIKTQQKVSATANTTGGYGRYGRWGYGGGFSTTSINYNEYTDGTLIITLIDSESKKIVWQGVGTKTIDENASTSQRERNISYNIQKIMENYPPDKK